MELIPTAVVSRNLELGTISKNDYYSCHVYYKIDVLPPVSLPFYDAIKDELAARYTSNKSPTIVRDVTSISDTVIPITPNGAWDRYYANEIVQQHFKDKLADYVSNTLIGIPEVGILATEDGDIWNEIVDQLYLKRSRNWGKETGGIPTKRGANTMDFLDLCLWVLDNQKESYESGIIRKGKDNRYGLAYMVARCMNRQVAKDGTKVEETIARFFQFKYEYFLPPGTVHMNDDNNNTGTYFYCKDNPAKGVAKTREVGRLRAGDGITTVGNFLKDTTGLSKDQEIILNATNIDKEKGPWKSISAGNVIFTSKHKDISIAGQPRREGVLHTPLKRVLSAEGYTGVLGSRYLNKHTDAELVTDVELSDAQLKTLAENAIARAGWNTKKQVKMKNRIILCDETPNPRIAIGNDGWGSNRYGMALMKALDVDPITTIKRTPNVVMPPSMAALTYESLNLKDVIKIEQINKNWLDEKGANCHVKLRTVKALTSIPAKRILGHLEQPTDTEKEEKRNTYRATDKRIWHKEVYADSFNVRISKKPKWWKENWNEYDLNTFSYRYQEDYQWICIDAKNPNLAIDSDGTLYTTDPIRQGERLRMNPSEGTGKAVMVAVPEFEKLLDNEFNPNYKTWIAYEDAAIIDWIYNNTATGEKREYRFTVDTDETLTIQQRFLALREQIAKDRKTRETLIDDFSTCRIVDSEDKKYNSVPNLYGRMLMIIVQQLIYDRIKNMRNITPEMLDETEEGNLVLLGDRAEIIPDEVLDDGATTVDGFTDEYRRTLKRRVATLPYIVPRTDHIKSLYDDDGIIVLPDDVCDMAPETRPIITARAIGAISIYLALVYHDAHKDEEVPTVASFITKCLTRRPLVFLNSNDTYKTRYGESGVLFFNDTKISPGVYDDFEYGPYSKHRSQNHPGTDTELYMDYEDAIFSAMIGVSVKTPFVNDGRRYSR